MATVGRVPAGVERERIVLWGHVHVVDRVPVENRFLTFGGVMRLRGVDGSLTIADLRSPAPIVRWGGHSQGTDELTLAIGAFFGRLIVPVDFKPGAAARIDAVSPQVLFTAFLSDEMRRQGRAARHRVEPGGLDRWIATAWARARLGAETRVAAEALLADIGL